MKSFFLHKIEFQGFVDMEEEFNQVDTRLTCSRRKTGQTRGGWGESKSGERGRGRGL